MPNMLNLLKSRRSIRKFQEREIEKEKIDTILKSALLSPSSRGRRPWEFVAVTDKGLIQKLSQSKQSGSQFLKGAPLGIVVLANKNLCDVWIEDTSIVATIIQLTAQDLGLGSCWIQIRERLYSEDKNADTYIKEILNIPENCSVECIIAIGYPNENKEAYNEEDLLFEKVHYNGY
jgi:nitroreductase